jgi:hypothetical protein
MAARSVMQRVKDRTSDIDAAVDAMSGGNAPPKIGGAIAPGRGGGSGSSPQPKMQKRITTVTKPAPAPQMGKKITTTTRKIPQGN